MPVPALALAGVGIAQGLAKFFGAGSQDKELTNMVKSLGTYKGDPNVPGGLAIAKNQFNGRMAGATAAEQNILGAQINASDSVNRNAADSATALALASALQGNANSSIVDLASKEAIDRSARFNDLQQAIGMNNQEQARIWQDKLRQLNSLMDIKGVKRANIDTAIGDIGGGLGMLAGKLFK